mmetsp:Transcript_39225/g.34919  ORF Transcript_39225/g.34919 Transcript_39225/m.34919 type:complete len:84 (+) Transcript_39225:556-807(+)
MVWFFALHHFVFKRDFHEYTKSTPVTFWRRFKFTDNMTRFDFRERKQSDVGPEELALFKEAQKDIPKKNLSKSELHKVTATLK